MHLSCYTLWRSNLGLVEITLDSDSLKCKDEILLPEVRSGVCCPLGSSVSAGGCLLRRAGDLPLRARSLAVSFPMPVLAPVIITTFPSSFAADLHCPPATYLLQERGGGGHRPRAVSLPGGLGQGCAQRFARVSSQRPG